MSGPVENLPADWLVIKHTGPEGLGWMDLWQILPPPGDRRSGVTIKVNDAGLIRYHAPSALIPALRRVIAGKATRQQLADGRLKAFKVSYDEALNRSAQLFIERGGIRP